MQFSSDSYISTPNDEAFMTLLSSQRELLSQLSQENKATGNSHKTGRGFGPIESNTSNERRTSLDLMFSKRLSLGLGNDQYILPGFLNDGMLDASMHSSDPFALKGDMKRSKLEDPFDVPIKKKRRLSLGVLSPSFFEENLKENQKETRRNSIESTARDANDVDVLDDEVDLDAALDESLMKEYSSICFDDLEADKTVKPKVDPDEVKRIVSEFKSSMEKSQQSQQDIHDWDKKMGLKRSHSKTMRLSTRSRKKLRSLFKNELSALLAKF